LDVDLKNIALLGIATLLIIVSAVIYKTFESMNLQSQAKDTGLIISLANEDALGDIKQLRWRLFTKCDDISTSVPQLSSETDRGCLESMGVSFVCIRPTLNDVMWQPWAMELPTPEGEIEFVTGRLHDGDPRTTDLYATVYNGAVLGELSRSNYGACF